MMKEEFLQDVKGLSGVPIFGAIGVVALILGRVELFAELLIGGVVAYAVTFSIRGLYFVQRPVAQKYKGWLQKIDASSFPSLHAMRAGVLASVLAVFFADSLVTVFLSLCAAAVACSRVLLKRHHIRDVIAGLLLGVIIGIIVARLISF